MNNRDAGVLLVFAAGAAGLGAALGDRGGFLIAVGGIGAVLSVAALLWNLFADSDN